VRILGGFASPPKIGHYVPLGKADRQVPATCAHCGMSLETVDHVVKRRPRYAGKAGIVCDDCWPAFVRGPVYRKHCGV
jgi:hypothetical protein